MESTQDDQDDHCDEDVEHDSQARVFLCLVHLALAQEVARKSRGRIASTQRNHEDEGDQVDDNDFSSKGLHTDQA